MRQVARMALRPALLARLAGAQVAAAAACVSVGPKPTWPAGALVRHWSSTPSEEALRKAERMVELMGESPQLQQMILNVMPGPLRNPDVMKQMFGDPAMRKRIAEMIASRGFSIPDHILDRMTASSMGDTFTRAQRMGVDPSQMFAKLMAHPGLLAKLQQPHVMAAFLDIAEDPTRQAKYENDKELLEVVFKAREILGSAKSAPPAPSTAIPISANAATTAAATTSEGADEAGTASTPAAVAEGSSAAAGVQQDAAQPPPPGQPPRAEAPSRPEVGADGMTSESDEQHGSESTSSGLGGGTLPTNPLVILMQSDPKAARWLDNPRVMAALEEVNRSPWKTVKYVFNKEVMEAFKDLSNLMRGKKA